MEINEHINLIRENIYPPAWDVVNKATFPWHRYAHLPHSSQALAVDIFGTLMVLDQEGRDAIMMDFASSLGIPVKGPWSVKLEWLDERNLLNERRQTQVDVFIRSSETIICIECKFTESAGGFCSQAQPLNRGKHKGIAQCDGNYSRQINPVNRKTARCALTGKGIRYWDVISDVFQYSANSDYNPCPFAGSEFQWMRNMVLSGSVARHEGRYPAFVLMYADSPDLHIPKYLVSQAWRDFTSTIRPGSLSFQAVSFQSFIERAEESLNSRGISGREWLGLREWANRKIARRPKEMEN